MIPICVDGVHRLDLWLFFPGFWTCGDLFAGKPAPTGLWRACGSGGSPLRLAREEVTTGPKPREKQPQIKAMDAIDADGYHCAALHS
ncbi:hypothetical protein ACPZMI_00400, partial [Pseudomonas wayambapalatensis]